MSNPSKKNYSKLLINESPLMVLPTLAARIGLNEAIFVQQVHYWLQASKLERDGRCWTYNTVKQWNEQFPFWSERTIKYIVQSLKASGILLVAQYGSAFDKTNYYSIDYEILDAVGSESEQKEMGQSLPHDGAKAACGEGKHCPPMGQDLPHLKGQTLPHLLPENSLENSTETSTENPPKSPKGEDTDSDGLFDAAWVEYPRRAGGNSKANALKAWKARIKQGESPDEMLAGVIRYARFCKATEKTGTEFVKQAATFFGPAKHYLEDYKIPVRTGRGDIHERRAATIAGLTGQPRFEQGSIFDGTAERVD